MGVTLGSTTKVGSFVDSGLKAEVEANTASLADIVQVNVKNFGAKGDNVNDDTQGINNAIAQAVLIRDQGKIPTIIFPYAIGYKTMSKIIVPHGINVIMDAPIIYWGGIDEIALVIGDETPNNRVWVKLSVTRNGVSDWLNESSIGAQFKNMDSCNINLVNTDGFTIGSQFIGSGNGFSYNNITLGDLSNHKIIIDCTNESTGWCNENLFIGGRFHNNSGVNALLNRYGVRISSKNNHYNNNNVFIKPSFELKQAGSNEAIPILIEFGNFNQFENIRNENNSVTTARVSNNSDQNSIESGYGNISIEELGTNSSTYKQGIRDKISSNLSLVFKSSTLHKDACYYNGATNINVPSVHCVGSSNATIANNSSSLILNNRYLEVPASRGLGIFIDTTLNKKFVVKHDFENGYGGRINIRCYDIAGNILDSSGLNQPYVKGAFNQSYTFFALFGGVYKTGADGATNSYFVVGDDVAYISVILSGGTNPLRIRSFSVFSADMFLGSTWTGYEEIAKGANLATTPPTIGTWGKGRKLYNDNPTLGQPKGWICAASGIPGTWVSEGNL